MFLSKTSPSILTSIIIWNNNFWTKISSSSPPLPKQKEVEGNKHKVAQKDSDGEEPSNDEEMNDLGIFGKGWRGLGSSFGATSLTI